jgi:predicted nucleic acid-binding protein
MIIADTSGLIAAFGVDARRHRQARAAFEADPGPVILSPFVLAELDYLLLTRAGVKAELQLLQEVAGGVYELASFGRADTGRAAEVAERYAGVHAAARRRLTGPGDSRLPLGDQSGRCRANCVTVRMTRGKRERGAQDGRGTPRAGPRS